MHLRLIALLVVSSAIGCGGERQTPPSSVASTEDEALEPVQTPAVHPEPVDPAIAEFVRTLDEDPDMLHNDYTPSVHGLIAAGVPGALAVVDLLRSSNADTRLHARRVVVYLLLLL